MDSKLPCSGIMLSIGISGHSWDTAYDSQPSISRRNCYIVYTGDMLGTQEPCGPWRVAVIADTAQSPGSDCFWKFPVSLCLPASAELLCYIPVSVIMATSWTGCELGLVLLVLLMCLAFRTLLSLQQFIPAHSANHVTLKDWLHVSHDPPLKDFQSTHWGLWDSHGKTSKKNDLTGHSLS